MRRRRGMSLIETIVAMVVASLFGLAMVQLFTTGMRLYVRSQAKADLQTQGLMAMARLSEELRRSAMATLTVVPEKGQRGPALAFRPTEPDRVGQSNFTTVLWFAVYYLDTGSDSLMVKRWPAPQDEPVTLSPDPIAVMRRLTADEVIQVVQNRNGTEKKLAGQVESMAMTPASYPSLDKVTGLQIQLVLSGGTGSSDPRETLHVAITPRNTP